MLRNLLPYSGVFSRVQNFAKLLVEPSEEIFGGFNFRACALWNHAHFHTLAARTSRTGATYVCIFFDSGPLGSGRLSVADEK